MFSIICSGGYQGYGQDGSENADQFYARSNADGKLQIILFYIQ